MTEPSGRISMSCIPQNFSIFSGENPRIGISVAEEHDPEPVRRKTADDFFRGEVLRICVRFIRERWREYSKHEGV